MSDKIKEAAFYHTKIKEWPEAERPREKLLTVGATSLSDAELLALLIESGTGGITALDLAKRLLVEHKRLSGLAAIGAAELGQFKGIGPARSARILAAIEIGRRILGEREDKAPKIDSPDQLASMFLPRFRGAKKEVFKVVLLDGANRIIRDVTISEGTLNASLVHPREVFKEAVDKRAASVILMHNHPSGEAYPSEEDRRVTNQMVQAGEVLGIPVLDHLVLGETTHFSFTKEGLIK